MADIIKVYREHLPEPQLTGEKHIDTDGVEDGGFGGKWEKRFSTDWFGLLKEANSMPKIGIACLRCIRCADGFEPVIKGPEGFTGYMEMKTAENYMAMRPLRFVCQ